MRGWVGATGPATHRAAEIAGTPPRSALAPTQPGEASIVRSYAGAV